MIPKSKKGGVVTSTVMGVGGLIIGVIIILVITSTILNANLFQDALDTSVQTNESTVTAVTETGVTLVTAAASYNPTCTVTAVAFANDSELIGADTNYTMRGDGGCEIYYSNPVDGSANNSVWVVNYSMTLAGQTETSTRDMQSNFTSGIDNISEKIPTILLIIAVVFLFGALVLLVRQSQAMGVGGGGSL